jgi:hypothetical protein
MPRFKKTMNRTNHLQQEANCRVGPKGIDAKIQAGAEAEKTQLEGEALIASMVQQALDNRARGSPSNGGTSAPRATLSQISLKSILKNAKNRKVD